MTTLAFKKLLINNNKEIAYINSFLNNYCKILLQLLQQKKT